MNQVVPEAHTLEVDYFDGRSAKRRPARMHLCAQHLAIEADGVQQEFPLKAVRWPERTRHGVRIAYFDNGGSVQCADAQAWDRWAAACGLRESRVVTLQQSWRWAAVSGVALIVLLVLGYFFVLPAAAQLALQATPLSMDASVGSAALQALENAGSMKPSKLPVSEQQDIERQLTLALADTAAELPVWKVVFRQSDWGANAFALPGGTLVITDGLVELTRGKPQLLSAVLAHELGHLQYRHGMLLLTQVSALGLAASAIWGDFSGTLASVPVLLGAAGYSRDAERQADAFAATLLLRLHRSPMEMVDVLKALEEDRKKHSAKAGVPNPLAIAFASHPLDAERMLFFQTQANAAH